MKRILLIVAMVAMLIAVVFVGQASGFPGANITVSPSSGAVGTTVRITGSGWTPGVPVNIYMDVTDEAHLLATVTPQYVGMFTVSFISGATTVGVHKITATQDSKTASAEFKLCVTQPIDERTGGVLSGIADEVSNIEGKLDDPSTGLAKITQVVANTESKIYDHTARLGEIKAELADIKATLANVPRMESFSGEWNSETSPGDPLNTQTYGEVRHVSLTLCYSGLHNANYQHLQIWSCGESIADWFWYESDPSNSAADDVCVTLEFNTYSWMIQATIVTPSGALNVAYQVTITYVPEPSP